MTAQDRRKVSKSGGQVIMWWALENKGVGMAVPLKSAEGPVWLGRQLE